MTIRKAIRLSTLLGCMVACLVYAKAQTPEAANTTTNTVPTQPQNQATPTQEVKNIRFQFDGIPYMTVVERFAQMAGRPLLVDMPVEGTLKFSDPEPYAYKEALDTLNIILSMKDASLVEQDRYLRLMPLSKLKQTPLKVLTNLEERGDVRPGEVVTIAMHFENLDPNEIAQTTTTMLSNAGSVFPMGQSKGLLITDRIENIERIEQLLTLADVPPTSSRAMKTFNIVTSSGPVLTDLINRTFGVATAPVKSQFNVEKNRYFKLPPDPEDYVTAVWDGASKTMVVFGPKERLALAEELIQRFENKDGVVPTDVRIFYPVENTPDELAGMIRQSVSGVANIGEDATTAATKARIVIDNRLKRLIITAPVAEQMKEIEDFIKKVDPATVGNLELEAAPVADIQIFYPKYQTPAELESILRQTVSGIAEPGERVSNKARLVLDAKQGRLIVVSPDPDQLNLIKMVVEKVDTEDKPEPPVMDTKIFYPRYVDPNHLVSMLKQMLPELASQQGGPQDKVKTIVDLSLRRLMVMCADAKLMNAIEIAISKIDSQGGTEFPEMVTKMFYPKFMTPSELNSMLRQVLPEVAALKGTPQDKVRLIIDNRMNRLVVMSSDEKLMADIEEAISKIDSEGEKEFPNMATRIFYPKYMTPADIANMLRQMLPEVAALKGTPQDKARLIVDPVLDRLVVLCSDETLMNSIAQAIQQIDVEEDIASIDENGNTELNGRNETLVVRLEYALAAEIGSLIRQTFSDRRSGVKVLVEDRSNSLVLNGRAAVLDAAKEVISALDVQPSSVSARQIRFIDIQGEPYHIASLATQLLAEKSRIANQQQTVQERRRLQRADVPRIIPEPYSQRLIIFGTDEELQVIKEIIDKVDLENGGSAGVKVFRLRSANPYEMASIVNNYVNTYREKRRGGPRPTVFVDSRNNSLVVCGSISDIEQASTLIEQIDTNQKIESRGIKIFSAGRNDPYELMNRVRSLYMDRMKAEPDAGVPDAMFVPDYSTFCITVAANESQLKIIEELFTLLQGEESNAQTELRRFDLKGTNPEIIRSALSVILESSMRGRGIRPWIYPDWTSNSIFVYGRTSDIEKASQIITDLDNASAENPREMKVFTVESQSPWEFANQVRSLYRDQVSATNLKSGSNALFLPDGSGRLIVTAPQNQMPMIEEIISTLNQDSVMESGLHIFKLQHANVHSVYPLANHVISQRTWGKRSLSAARPTLTLDVANNAIVVYGTPKDIEQVGELIQKLDESNIDQVREMKTYRIVSRNVHVLINQIQVFYNDQMRSHPELGVADAIFLPDPEFNCINVAATKDQLTLIDGIVNKLEEREALPDRQLKLIPVANGRNYEIINALSYLLNFRRNQRTAEPGPWITPETRTGGIYIYGTAEDIKYAEELINEFNKGDGINRVIKTYDIQDANMTLFANNVRGLYQDQMKGNEGLGIADAYIYGDPYSGKLIVGLRENQVSLVDELVQTLKEKSEAAEPIVQIFSLKFGRPSRLVPVLNSVLYSRINRNAIATQITPDDENGKLIVSGTTGEVDRIGKLIEQLDSLEDRDARLLKIFEIESLDVWGYASQLRQLYVDQLKGIPDAGPANAMILPDDFSGRLIVAASEKQMQVIENIMNTLQEMPSGKLELRTYKLEYVYTSDAIRTINTLMQGSLRMRRWGGGSNRDTLTMTPDERNNTIVVMGSPSKLEMLDMIIKTIDQKPEKPDREVRFYTLENVDAFDVELRLDGLFNDVNRPEQVVFESDILSNTLTVVAREKDFEEIEEMIHQMDNVARDMTEIVRLIPVSNMSVTQMSKVLLNIYPQVSSAELEMVDKLPTSEDKTSTEKPVAAEAQQSETPVDSTASLDSEENKTEQNTPSTEVMEENKAGENTIPVEKKAKVTIAVDTDANTLIVSGPSFEVDRIRSIVSQLQSSYSLGDSEIRMFRLNEADPVLVARTLNELFRVAGNIVTPNPEERRQQPEEAVRGRQVPQQPQLPRAIIVPETRTRSIIVRARPSEFIALESLVKQLDADGIDSLLEYRVIPIKNAAPIQIVQMLNQVIQQLQIIRPGDPVAISVDNRTNSLFVVARDTMMDKLEEIISKLDVDTDTTEMQVKIYPLKYISGNQMGTLLQGVFSGANRGASRWGRAPQGGSNTVRILKFKDESGEEIRLDMSKPVMVISDPSAAGINRLIVGVPKTNLTAVDELVRQLDRELPDDLSGVRIIPLKNADATLLVTSLQRLIQDRQRRNQGDEVRSTVLADERSNSLIIGGSNANMELLEDLAIQLDNAEPGLLNSVRIIPLEHATSQRLSSTLTTLLQRRVAGGSRGGQLNRTVVLPDPRTNSLLIAASDADSKLLDELIAKLDKPFDNPNLEPQIITLEQNEAVRLAATIRSVFAARLQALAQSGVQPDPQDRVNVEADLLSNSLIITASKENMKVVSDLVQKLDQEPTAEGLVETITLKYADVQRVTTMLRTLVQQGVYRPGSGSLTRRGGSGSSRDSFAVVPDIPSNTLVISASPENMALARELIKEIDTEENYKYSDVKTFTLKHARAGTIINTLNQFFQRKASAERAAGIRERALAVTIAADERSNVILVTAGKEDIDLLEKMLIDLDTAEIDARMSFNIYPLKNATASKLQMTLQRLFQNRPARIRGVASDPITVVADSWANALIIGAGPDDVEMVESLIAQLDKPEVGEIKVQVFPMVHADAQRVATTVQALLRGQSGGYGGTGPTVSVDERTNAIIVSAGDNDIKRLEELVKKLDTAEVERVNEIRIFPLNFARASETATLLNSILNQNPRNLNQTSTSRQALLQFITRTPEGEELISSALHEGILITPDTRSNSLIVSAPVDYMGFLESLVQRLDQSLPQEAKIQIFSLKNADARQMAQVLTALFRLQVTSGAAAERSVQYTLVKPLNDFELTGAETDVVEGEEGKAAVVGSAEQYALTVTVDLRTNTVLVGGTEHYVSLAKEIIETLDAHPAQERQAKVYRLKNSSASDIEVALRTFLQEDLSRMISVLGQSATGAAQTILDREVSIVAESTSNALLISASPRYFAEVEKLIEELDQPLPQVLVQVVLAEVTLDSNTALGVEWSYSDSVGNTPFTLGTDYGIADAISEGGFNTAITGSKVNFMLRAFQEDGRLEVLSRPQILTADNVQANISIGQQVPIVTDNRFDSYGNQIASYEYQDVGVILTVTPRIGPDGTVKMEVSPEVSQLTSSGVEVSANISIPIISRRTAETTVSVQSGQSVLIGGLISTTDDSRTKKVPWIGNIPVLGALFRSKTYETERKELLIILTPQVIMPSKKTYSNIMTPLEMTEKELTDSILQTDLNREPLQKKVLGDIIQDKPEENLDKAKDKEKKKREIEDYTKELLINP